MSLNIPLRQVQHATRDQKSWSSLIFIRKTVEQCVTTLISNQLIKPELPSKVNLGLFRLFSVFHALFSLAARSADQEAI